MALGIASSPLSGRRKIVAKRCSAADVEAWDRKEFTSRDFIQYQWLKVIFFWQRDGLNCSKVEQQKLKYKWFCTCDLQHSFCPDWNQFGKHICLSKFSRLWNLKASCGLLECWFFVWPTFHGSILQPDLGVMFQESMVLFLVFKV